MKINRAERRRIEKVADRIDIGGYDLCRGPLGGPVPHHFGYRLGKLVGVCEGCIAKLDMGLIVRGTVHTFQSEADEAGGVVMAH